MDREAWMYELRHASDEYRCCLILFSESCWWSSGEWKRDSLWCPGNKCHNCKNFNELNIIEEHLICNGFVNDYTCWTQYGELLVHTENNGDDIDDSQNDNFVN